MKALWSGIRCFGLRADHRVGTTWDNTVKTHLKLHATLRQMQMAKNGKALV